MALTIKSNDKKILIKGTDVELESVYGRIQMVARASGKDMEVYLDYYASKEQYDNNEPLAVDIPFKVINVTEMKEDEVQSVNKNNIIPVAPVYKTSKYSCLPPK